MERKENKFFKKENYTNIFYLFFKKIGIYIENIFTIFSCLNSESLRDTKRGNQNRCSGN